MFRFIRLFGNIVLWTLAVVGIIAGGFWLATATGMVQPLVVISGSMEPGIDTGDLLIATKTDTADLHVGDVVSLPSDVTHNLVTHRIVEITPLPDGQWEIEMKGDANEGGDIEPYIVGDDVWQPALRIPNVGTTISAAMQPAVILPAVLALLAFFGFAVLSDDDEEEEEDADRDDDRDDGDHDGDGADAAAARSADDDRDLLAAGVFAHFVTDTTDSDIDSSRPLAVATR